MCGFIGIVGLPGTHAAPELYEGLIALQHRGQDAAGILSFDGMFHLRKQNGMVRDIFRAQDMTRLQGNLAIAHVRYPTVGMGSDQDAQPFYINFPFGVGMTHNGNLTNWVDLRSRQFPAVNICMESSCDVEAILYAFAKGLQDAGAGASLVDRVRSGTASAFDMAKGAYSVCGLLSEGVMFGFRDPAGIKPCILGRRDSDAGVEWALASESVALDILGFHRVRDLRAGEAVILETGKEPVFIQVGDKPHTPCIFELVYFSRPDSFLDEISVYKTRRRFGESLAEQWVASGAPKPDVVIPIPDSARDSALSMAHALDVSYREGFVKNRYIGRTFIMPNNEARKKSIHRKLNPIPLEFEGKDVLLVDDSIVRGNTSGRIIEAARAAGARNVYFATTSPPLVAVCPYGIDMATQKDFVAQGRSVDEVRQAIGADHLVYLELDRMVDCARVGNPEIKGFCTGCFTGEYPTADAVEHIDALSAERASARD
ncbi:MAG: amidophosphoribosyltransferase [Planctomycetes bacterium]|jgi:amidophosphoribosyltransferase|nr:amidophosphoribosyltransferase [Planctomycetota bacterium]MBT4027850.1 amidophosphoribosyltransferase [Planctomycetota bacterium]MBT4559355.1 amidophosphoribosyltransferase [Planctomycetota bacterium]MBT5102201.1 amidophosphoribosyltransferase [Planctomycetota bacterium]MBT7013213.1 amidophosphoribosyltransferase [Planctomycetota bacterium]